MRRALVMRASEVVRPAGVAHEMPRARETLRQFLRFALLVREHWAGVMKSVGLSLALAALGMAVPYVSKLLVDRAYPTGDIGFLHVLLGWLIVLMASSAWLSALQGYSSQAAAGRLGSAATLAFFNHLQHLPASFFDAHAVGEIQSRVADVRSGASALTTVAGTLVTSGVYLLAVPPFLVLLNWKLAVLAVVVFPVTIAISTATSRRVRGRQRVAAEASAGVVAYQTEVFAHIRSLKAMALEPHVYHRVERQTHAALAAALRAARAQRVVGAINGSLGAFGNVLFTWYAWTLILRHELTLGSFFAFSAYLAYVTTALARLGSLFDSLQQAAVWLSRMFEYLALPPEQHPALSYRPAPPVTRRLRGDITFHGVTCGYALGRYALRDLHVRFHEGEMTAIVGPSGAGKSTLLRLIPRLLDPEDGRVTIGGTDVRDLGLPDLRRQIGVVWQEPVLLRGTLRQNLVLDDTPVRQARIEEAIEVAQLVDLIAQLPHGLDTGIGEWGATVSGGQRQRIAIARALIRDAPILLLDESLANLDSDTERAVLDGLRTRYTDRTILLVTHRAAAAARADRVCVIERGRVAAAASPAEVADLSVSDVVAASDGRGAPLERR